MKECDHGGRWSRREFLASTAVAGAAATTSGCLDMFDDGELELIGDGPTVGLETVAEGLTYPTDLKEPDDGTGRLFVTDQQGAVFVIEDGELLDTPFLDVSPDLVNVGGDDDGFDERGLVGIEFHPDFATNNRFFLRYSTPLSHEDPSGASHAEVLVEFEADGETADPDSATELLRIPQPSIIHNSGNIHFGPDGFLYIPTGDGGGLLPDHDEHWFDGHGGPTGQNTEDNLLGGVLRIDVDAGGADEYGIPDDNPLVDMEGHRDEYYAWGFRNPWGSTFDGDDLYVADVGQAMFEIVNHVERGGNYGWSVKEGTHCYDADDTRDPPAECPQETPEDVRGGEPLLDPVIEYPQFDNDTQIGSAVIGGHYYRNGVADVIHDYYVFGDWSADPHVDPNGRVFAARPPAADEDRHEYFEERDLWPIVELSVESDNDVTNDGNLQRYIAALGQDLSGDVYLLTTETNEISGDTGEVHRIVAAE